MLTDKEIADIFDVEEDNISSHLCKKTANLKWVRGFNEEIPQPPILMQEIFVRIHLKRLVWQPPYGYTSTRETTIWEAVPYEMC